MSSSQEPRKLAIAHVDSELGFSGGEVQVFLLMEGLAGRGHRNVLFCPPGSGADSEARARGVETVPVEMRSDLDLFAVRSLRRAFRTTGVDLVHLHTGRAGWLGGWAARRARLPALTTRRMDRAIRPGWRTRLRYESFVQRVVAISPAVARCLMAGGVPAERVTTIPSSVDPGALTGGERARTRAALEAAEGDLVLLTLAALVPRKGVDLLVRALARLRAEGSRAVLWVAGDGPERVNLEALGRELELGRCLRFLGRRDDKRDLLAGCDVFCLTPHREGLGVAALEALAAGRPVLATGVGGLAEVVVDRETGILVPPGDVMGIVRALRELECDAELRRRCGAAGPERVAEGFLATQMVAAYEGLYHQVLADSMITTTS